MAVQYSPLCDVSLPAYLAYCISNGQRTFGIDVGRRAEGDTRCGGRGGDDGSCVDDMVGDDAVTRQAWLGVVRSYCDVISGVGSVGNSAAQLQCGVEGVTGGRTCNCDGSVVGGDSNDSQTARNGHEDSYGVSVGSNGPETLEVGGSSKGKTEAKPGRWRARNKRKKELKRIKLAVGEVEEKEGLMKPVTMGLSLCADSVKKELAESRAAALIEKNKWEAYQYGHKMHNVAAYGRYNKMRAVAQQAELEQKLLDLGKKRGVQGWAETLVSDSTKSMSSAHSAWSGSKGSSGKKSSVVSPNSSVSVEALEARCCSLELQLKAGCSVALKDMEGKVKELQKESEVQKVKVRKLVEENEKLKLDMNGFGMSRWTVG